MVFKIIFSISSFELFPQSKVYLETVLKGLKEGFLLRIKKLKSRAQTKITKINIKVIILVNLNLEKEN